MRRTSLHFTPYMVGERQTAFSRDVPGEIFFLLKAKCPEVAAELAVSEGAPIFVGNRSRRRR